MCCHLLQYGVTVSLTFCCDITTPCVEIKTVYLCWSSVVMLFSGRNGRVFLRSRRPRRSIVARTAVYVCRLRSVSSDGRGPLVLRILPAWYAVIFTCVLFMYIVCCRNYLQTPNSGYFVEKKVEFHAVQICLDSRRGYVSSLRLYVCYMDRNGTVSIRCIYSYYNFVVHLWCICIQYCTAVVIRRFYLNLPCTIMAQFCCNSEYFVEVVYIVQIERCIAIPLSNW